MDWTAGEINESLSVGRPQVVDAVGTEMTVRGTPEWFEEYGFQNHGSPSSAVMQVHCRRMAPGDPIRSGVDLDAADRSQFKLIRFFTP
jgi:hypothetical protein